MEYISNSAEETYEIASRFAKQLNKGDIITLDGDLGAGKTAFVRGLADGLGLSDMVVSPTFTIVNEYRHGDVPLFHFDVYRLECDDDLYDIGWNDYVNRRGIIIMEWASVVKDEIDCPYIEINIARKPEMGENVREINIDYRGENK